MFSINFCFVFKKGEKKHQSKGGMESFIYKTIYDTKIAMLHTTETSATMKEKW